MTIEEMLNLVDNISGEEKDMLLNMIEESIESEKSRKKEASWVELRNVPYELVYNREVPSTLLIRYFLYTFEFCRHRYMESGHFDDLVGYYFDDAKFLFLLKYDFGISVDHDAVWSIERMKELMLSVEEEIKPEYREMLEIKIEKIDRLRQKLLDLFIYCNHQKKLRFGTNPAFTDIDFNELNQHLYTEYHIYLSAAERRTLNTVDEMIDHIIYRLKDGNGSL